MTAVHLHDDANIGCRDLWLFHACLQHMMQHVAGVYLRLDAADNISHPYHGSVIVKTPYAISKQRATLSLKRRLKMEKKTRA